MRAARALERAFSTDPMFRWIFPNPGHRSRSLRWLYRILLEYGLRYGRVTQCHGGLAVAIWLPPGCGITMGRMVRSGALGAPVRVGARALARLMGADMVLRRMRRRHVPEPHWFLMTVGVDPGLQGRGLGTALVREGLARADEAHRPSYLETTRERNLVLYERQGFEVVETGTLGDGVAVWAMRRDPRAG